MTKMNLNKSEIDVMVATMEAADFGKEIEIEIVDEDNWEETESDDGHRDLYAAEFEGHGTYEDYEPNPYDGTYSEM